MSAADPTPSSIRPSERPPERPSRKALIKVGYGCNEHCSFCHTADVRDIQGSAAEVEAKIDRAARLGHTMVVLSGGEPTIRPELLRWAQRIAEAGLDVGLVTNGLVLAYPDVVAKLRAQRLRYVYMSLHGGEASVHDRLVRTPGSFDIACRALDNLTGRRTSLLGAGTGAAAQGEAPLDLTINCVVTRHNVDHLRPLVELAQRWPQASLKFSAVEPKGGADHRFDALVPDVVHAAKRVAEAIVHARSLGRTDVGHGGYPLCLLRGLEDAYDDLRTHDFRTMVEIGEADYFPVDDTNKAKPPEICGDCRLAGPCPGLFVEYVARRGTAALRPVSDAGPRGNAFDWVFEGRLPASTDAAACPIREEGPTPWDRGRDLLVRHDGKVARYRAESRDFDDDAIARIKHAQGQLYLDASKGPAPQDFARDLVKLVRAPVCRGCPHEQPCTGLFEPVLEDWFSRDDAAVREHLATLQGDVLDVGCGEGPYDDVLGPRAERGAITWTGIEPDAALAAEVEARRPWGRVHALAAEALGDADGPLGDARFDHALVLRSWNHLRDPGTVIDSLVGRLRPGGSLLVVDNVAFGLARTPAQSRRARALPLPLEHHRNDDAQAALRRIEGRALARDALRLEERRDVAPDTANQWRLRLRRVACATIDP